MFSSSFFFTTSVFSGTTFFGGCTTFFEGARLFSFSTTFSFRHDSFFLARLFFFRHDFFLLARLLVFGTTFFTQHYRSPLTYRSFIWSESSTWWPQNAWNVFFCYFCFWYHFPRARGFCLPTRHFWTLNVGILLNATFIWALAIVRSCCSWDHCMAVF